MRAVGGLGVVAFLGVIMGSSGCGSTSRSPGAAGSSGMAGSSAAAGSAGESDGAAGGDAGTSMGGTAAGKGGTGGGGGTKPQGGVGGAPEEPPSSCEEAAHVRTHLGCEFWPTLVANPVWTEFSAGLKLVNAGATEASVVITGPSNYKTSLTVASGETKSVLLPWVPELKGPEFSRLNTSGARTASSANVPGAAYKLESSAPIAAWQFSPLVTEQPSETCGGPPGSICRGASGDASLLLPSTTLTGNYRVLALSAENGGDWGSTPGAFAITATRDSTKVQVQLGPHCGAELFPTKDLGACTAAGTGVVSKKAGEVYDFTMNAGDVVVLAGAAAKDPKTKHADVSGSIINADQPVQVISFVAIASVPDYSVYNGDHLEETVPPAESFGKKYVVMPPSAPAGSVGHVVRLYGNVDGTSLSYPDGKPTGAPDVINAGEVVQIPPAPGMLEMDCQGQPSHCVVKQAFTVEGSQPFGVASFLPGGTVLSPGADPGSSFGDPAASWIQTPVQFRQSYVVVTPDTTQRIVDIVAPTGAKIFLDNDELAVKATAEVTGWQAYRLDLPDPDLHLLTTDHPAGMSVQIIGFSIATGYYYPAGGNFKLLSKPPLVVP